MAESDEQKRAAPSKQLHATINRIEDGEMAVIFIGDDEKAQIDLPLSLLPHGVGDGDHLRISISVDKASRDAAASRVRSLQEKLTQQSGPQEQKDFKL